MRFTLASLVVMCCRAQQNDICHSIHGFQCSDPDIHPYSTGVLSSKACCHECSVQIPPCAAWSWNWKDHHCHLHSACTQKYHPHYHSGLRRSPTPTEIAEQANALFAKHDDGVIFRQVHPDLPAIDKDEITSTSLSFSRLNNYAWGDGMIQLFRNGTRPAIIAKPHANEHVKCQFPCDGNTKGRHYTCKVTGCPCHGSGEDDWCDHKLQGTRSKPCAFKPDETAKMMKEFRKVQVGTSPLLKNKACGYYHIPGQSHNEIVIDPKTWNKYIKDNLWAFVLTDACTGACETNLRRLHDGAKTKYGDIPILTFNRKDKEHPFHVIRTNDGGFAADEKAGGASETEEEEGSTVNASAVELGGLASMDVIV